MTSSDPPLFFSCSRAQRLTSPPVALRVSPGAGLGADASTTFLGTGGVAATAASAPAAAPAAVDISDTPADASSAAPEAPAAPAAATTAEPEVAAAPSPTAAPAASSVQGYAAAQAAGDMPSSSKSHYVSADERMAETGGKLLYGLDKELAEKAAAKYDPQLEGEARAWIEAMTGEPLEGALDEALKSGVVLCNLLRAVDANLLKPPSKMAMPFKQMENIGNYLGACSKLGLQAHDSFQTIDLYEGKDMLAVVRQIHALGRLLQKRPGYSGPTLGVKEADANKREFTEEQMLAAKGTTTFLGKGSHGTAGGAMSKVEAGRVQVRGNVAGTEGLGTGGEATFVGTGSNSVKGS